MSEGFWIVSCETIIQEGYSMETPEMRITLHTRRLQNF